jgi:hypothetical protein
MAGRRDEVEHRAALHLPGIELVRRRNRRGRKDMRRAQPGITRRDVEGRLREGP